MGLLGVPFPEETPTPTPLSSERSGCWLRGPGGPGFPQTLPAPWAGSGGTLGGAPGPLRASFWRRLGVIDRSLGNAIRLSRSEGRAGGGRAGEARGFLEAAPRRLARRSRAGALLAGAWPARGAGNPDPLQENRSGSVPAVRPLRPRGRAKPCATRGVGWGSL